MSTKSSRKIVIGEIDNNKPKNLIKKQVNKDSKRYIRSDDIIGASPKEEYRIPIKHLEYFHPDF